MADRRTADVYQRLPWLPAAHFLFHYPGFYLNSLTTPILGMGVCVCDRGKGVDEWDERGEKAFWEHTILLYAGYNNCNGQSYPETTYIFFRKLLFPEYSCVTQIHS